MIFLDFEVFEKDWLAVFADLKKKEETVIVNDRKKLSDFYEKNKSEIFIGFNIRHYDQWIFKALLIGLNPKEVNDKIIIEKMSPWNISRSLYKVPMAIYDVMKATDRGLKTFEGFMGYNIKETSVPFDIDRKLTEEEIEEVIEYCRYDVKETIEIFIERQNDFLSHVNLVEMASNGHLNARLISMTHGQLSAEMLKAVKKERDDEFDIILPDTLKVRKYKEVVEWYLASDNRRYRVKHKDKKPTLNSLDILIAGVPHRFAWGGVHGAIESYHGSGNFVLCDITSMYPSLIIEYGLLSRNCPQSSYDIYEKIYHERLKLKAEGKKKEQEPLKLFLNSTYGIMKDKYNKMYDPLMANTICVYGQLFILDFIEKIESFAEIIQSNTDGVLVKLKRKGDFERLKKEAEKWQERTGLNFEFEFYKRVIQKDVNNYVLVSEDDKIISKGSYVKRLSKLDYDLPIVNETLINFMAFDIPIEKTINDCDDLIDFQLITKISNKYDYFIHDGKILDEKTIRIFSTRNKNKGKVMKKHVSKTTYDNVSNCPNNAEVFNGDITGKKVPSWLDRSYYIELAKRRLKHFGY